MSGVGGTRANDSVSVDRVRCKAALLVVKLLDWAIGSQREFLAGNRSQLLLRMNHPPFRHGDLHLGFASLGQSNDRHAVAEPRLQFGLHGFAIHRHAHQALGIDRQPQDHFRRRFETDDITIHFTDTFETQLVIGCVEVCMIPIGWQRRLHLHTPVRIVRQIAKQTLNHRAAEPAGNIGEINAAIRMTQAAGRKKIATIPVGCLRFEIAETAFGKCSFQQVPACVGQPRPEVSQREMIDVTTIQLPHAPYRRQPVGGLAKLPAIRQSDALQPPLGIVKGADGFEGRRHP